MAPETQDGQMISPDNSQDIPPNPETNNPSEAFHPPAEANLQLAEAGVATDDTPSNVPFILAIISLCLFFVSIISIPLGAISLTIGIKRLKQGDNNALPVVAIAGASLIISLFAAIFFLPAFWSLLFG